MEEQLSLPKRLLFGAITVVIVLVSVELLMRILLATQVGPGILMYGTNFHSGSAPIKRYATEHLNSEQRAQRTAQLHKNVKYSESKERRYAKYFPNEKKIDIDQDGQKFSVAINRDGFRGRDFERVKEAGVVRVVTLGASSTFGFHNRDDQTYPSQLEALLNQEARGEARYEVINLGIPHLTSDEIYAVFLDEALPLKPDIVTLYEGFNDSTAEVKAVWKQDRLFQDLVHDVSNSLISVKFLVETVLARQDWFGSTEVEDKIAGQTRARYLGNAEKILDECRKRGIYFIIATQPSKSFAVAPDDLRGFSYEKEEAMLRGRDSSDSKTKWELYFITLASLNDAVRAWAKEHNVPLVDVVDILSEKRDLLLTWVHPGPQANALIADALAKPILQYEQGQAAAEVR